MLILITNTLMLISLGLIFIQDLKYRQIHILLPILLLGIGLFQYFYMEQPFIDLIYSTAFLTTTLLGGYLYIIIKNRQVINPFKSIIGIGDIFYFIAILPFFSTKNYILYFITGMFFSLLGFLVLKAFSNTIKTVPLAGLLALYFIGLKIYSYTFSGFNFFTSIL